MLLASGLPIVALSADGDTGENDPPVPSAADLGDGADAPGGSDAVRVALVDTGVNYTLPSVLAALARHPDGTLVGRDFRDLDDRPFDRHVLPNGRVLRHGTRTASVLIDEAPLARLVPYRFPDGNMQRMEGLVRHAAANEVRVIGLPLGGSRAAPWEAFERAAKAHPHLLFVTSAGNEGRDIDVSPVWPAVLPLDNLIVVTSADDFGQIADGVNRGRTSVDYLVPAEHVPVLQFDGTRGTASGSSYAVPRVVALAARLLVAQPDWRAAELVAELRRRFADGSHPRDVREGFIVDPLAVGEAPAIVVAERTVRWPDESVAPDVRIPLDVLVPNGAWSSARTDRTLARAAGILDACGIAFQPLRVRELSAPQRLADLSPGSARTLFDAVRASGAERRVTVVLGRDTRMADPYDGEAFGRANTRHRPWLRDTVWLTAVIEDAGIALAHELFHVLSNSGAHVPRTDNLMHARTSGDNTVLAPGQCEAARRTALDNGLAVPAPPAAETEIETETETETGSRLGLVDRPTTDAASGVDDRNRR